MATRGTGPAPAHVGLRVLRISHSAVVTAWRQRERLLRAGYRVRVYVPFGSEWYPYFMRRLAERPANVLFMARALVREGFGRDGQGGGTAT